MGILLSCLRETVEDGTSQQSQGPAVSKPPAPHQTTPTAGTTGSTSQQNDPSSKITSPSPTTSLIPNDNVLRSMSLSDAVQLLWKLDSNRLRPGVDYKINVQQGKKPWWKEDKAADPLFTFVSDSVWKRPTYRSFRNLLEHYQNAETGQAETMTPAWKRDIDAFLSHSLQTPVLQFCHRYCQLRNRQGENLVVPPDAPGFSQLLVRLWFDLYRRQRGGPLDSSGFEHVFVGEIRDNQVSGFHNWIRFALEERRGPSMLDYRGYIKPKSVSDAPTDGNDHLLTIQFIWKHVTKDMATMFVGVSPEFELALYTLCFVCGGEKNVVRLHTGTDVFDVEIVCHRMHGNRIGTVYPYVQSHHEA